MTQHKGLPVAGYVDQNQDKIDTVNIHKQLEELVLRQLDTLSKDPEVDQRWLAIARTEIEKGFMAMNRAVFQPVRINLSGEG